MLGQAASRAMMRVSPKALLFLVAACALLYSIIRAVEDFSLFDCGDEVISESVSPNGQLTAVVFDRNCGATTDYSTQVSLRSSTQPFDSKRQAPFLILEHRYKVVLSWRSQSKLVIHLPRGADVFRKELEKGGISLEYETQ